MRYELFKFVRGSTVWTYTSSDVAIVYDSETYTPQVIGHGERASRSELSKENLVVNISLASPLAIDLLSYFGEEIMTMTLFVSTDSGTDVAWKGRYVNQKPSGNQLALVIESIFTSLGKPGLRARYQKTCRHTLYGTSCGLSKSSFELSTSLTAISGVTLTVPGASAEDDGYYLGGMIQSLTDNSLRWVVNHVGGTLTLVRPFEQLELDIVAGGGTTTVKVYPGCKHTRGVCLNKFNNILNFGGFPWIPKKNPMGGSSIV